MTNGEKHIERLLSWYKEAVTEDGVCYLTSDDKNTLAYALKCCKHFEDIKKDNDSWMLRNNPSGSEKPNKSEIPTGSTTKKCATCAYREIDGKPHEMCKSCICGNRYREDAISRNEVLEMIEQIQVAGGFIGYNTCSKAFDVIDTMPPVTPIRPKGQWIDHSDEGYVECPRCGSATTCDGNISDLHFCFSCGADMRGEEE